MDKINLHVYNIITIQIHFPLPSELVNSKAPSSFFKATAIIIFNMQALPMNKVPSLLATSKLHIILDSKFIIFNNNSTFSYYLVSHL